MSARLPTLLLLTGALAACRVYNPALLEGRDAAPSDGGGGTEGGEAGRDGNEPDGVGRDGEGPDGGEFDASDAEGGAMTAEAGDVTSGDGCAGGRMCGSRCVDTMTDPANCGACGMRCDLLTRVRPDAVQCVAGSCVLTNACQVGYENCDSMASNGCETQISLDERCGACGTSARCSGETPRCTEVPIASGAGDAGVADAGQGGDAGADGGGSAPTTRFVCTNGCAAVTPNRCGMNCVSLQTDVANCGTCGRVCSAAANAVAACATGACALTCDTGFGNCDTLVGNGCETTLATDLMNCGACGTACRAPANGTATCAAGMCGARCNAGFVFVDGMCVGGPLRQIAPLSTTVVARERPTLRWALAGGADGARVEICRDRACSSLVGAFDAPGTSGSPMFIVPAGVNYWRVRGRMGSPGNFVTGLSSVWQFIVPRRVSPTAPDSSYGSRLDVNLDGFSDLVVGAYGAAMNTGRVFVYLGSASGLPTAPSTTLQPLNLGDTLFGRSVANLGDVNGDGFGDVGVVSLSGSKVFVYHGGAAGVGTMVATTIPTPSMTSAFGSSLAGVGDVNGDGYGDVVVGASGSATAHVYFGSATGIVPATSVRLVGNVSSQFGTSVAGPGDVNGDGLADIVVGAPNESRVYAFLSTAPSGVTGATAPVQLMGSGRAGAATASAGDVNADGYPDIVVGEPDSTQVRVWRGGPGGFDPSPPAPIMISGQSGFGSAVGGGCDVNGDGYDDIVVGASAASRGFVFRGNGVRTDTNPLPMLDGVAGQGFGVAVACPGDTDNTSTGEIVVGINNPAGLRYYRSGPGTFPTGDSFFNPPSVIGGTNNFGSAFGY